MANAQSPSLAHMVYFSLKDKSKESLHAFVENCNKYLSGHPGVDHFSIGIRAKNYERPVNDSDFDVAVNLLFHSEADHDQYQVSERHQEFLATQSENWSQVRIFDSFVHPGDS